MDRRSVDPDDSVKSLSPNHRAELEQELGDLRSRVRELEQALQQRERSQEALRASEAYLREIAIRLSGAVFSYDIDTSRKRTLVHIGPGFDKLVGRTVASRIAAGDVDAYFDLIHPDDLETMRKAGQFDAAFAQPLDQEYRLRTEAGTYKWIRALASPRRLSDGRLRWLGMLMDVTEHKRAEQDLRAKDQAVASSITPTALGDLEGRITYVNRAFLDAWGYDREDEVVGRLNTEFASSSSRIQQVTEVVRAHGGWMGEDTARKKDGTVFDVQLSVTRVADPDGVPFGIMASFVDITERKRAERALRESEERYRAVFEQAADSIVLFDAETGTWAEFNDHAHEALGYSRDEFAEYRIPDFDMVESADDVADHIARIVERGADTFETKQRTKEGAVRDVLVTARTISVRGRQLISAIWRDITERKRAEEALQYRIAFEALITSISTKFINLATDRIDQDIHDALKDLGEFADVDRSYVFEISEDGTRFSNTHEWCAPGIPPAINRLQDVPLDDFPWFWARISRRQTVHVPDVGALPQDARAERTEWRQEGIKSLICVPMVCGGALIGFVGFDSVRVSKTWQEEIIALLTIVGEAFANALERKRAEQALRRTTDTLNNILRSATEYAIVATDVDLRLIHYNPGAERIFGLPADRAVGRTVHELHEEAGVPARRVRRALETVSRQGKWETELRLATPDGPEKVVHPVVMPMRDERGAEIGYVLLARDVTAQKQAEEQRDRLESQLSHAVKLHAVGQLAAGVAHDFNTLLMVILGNVELLRQRRTRKADDAVRTEAQAWDLILNAIERGKALIQKLMEFGRTQASRPHVIDPNGLLVETVTLLRSLLGAHIDIRQDLAPDIKHINIDPGQLEQVVVNLVLNARDAMPEGGTLTIETANVTFDQAYAASHPDAALGAHVMIGVSDTGTGMSEDTRQRLFEPFFSTKPLDKGSGLGLSIVHGVVRQAGGHIEVESTPGEGSAFRLYFPAVE